MVDVYNSSSQVDLRPKSVGLVWKMQHYSRIGPNPNYNHNGDDSALFSLHRTSTLASIDPRQ